MSKNMMSEEAFDELIDGFEIVGKLTMYGRKNIKYHVQRLQQENKILRENAENNDKVVDNVNWENMLLKKENKQLKDNWNDLKKYAKEIISTDNELYGTDLLDKMKELEQGSDSDE